MSIVYLNGEFLASTEAFISVTDRGFLLGDACYEVTPVYRGSCFFLDKHLARLQSGLDAVRIDFDVDELESIHTHLIDLNDLGSAPKALVYVQVTRGAAPRTHAFPATKISPTVYVDATSKPPVTDAEFNAGSAAITHPDLRWMTPRIKTTNLLPNVLAQQAAVEAGAKDVVMHRDGRVTEGTRNNIFVVHDGVLTTPPADDLILPGVARTLVLGLAATDGMRIKAEAFDVDYLMSADEVFFTGTGTEIRPTIEVDGQPIGQGHPGPVTTRLKQLFDELIVSSTARGVRE